MDDLTLKTFVLGDIGNNCYLVFDKNSKKGFIIDCPEPWDQVSEFIQESDLEILFIALTHAHFDHIAGLDSNNFPFYVHDKDAPFLSDSKLNGSVFFTNPLKITRKPNLYKNTPNLNFNDIPIEVIPTPGHTPGSVSLKFGKWLFSGDAVFLNSIGRTDIPLASQEVLIRSIKENILILPSDTIIYPGHGPSTTVEHEKKANPFLC